LGIEALRRFVEGEPLHCVHECCFAVLALESEPVDPRLGVYSADRRCVPDVWQIGIEKAVRFVILSPLSRQ
jgi:hypothetical protein